MILADTSVWIDFLDGRSTLQADRLESSLALGRREILMGDLVLVEILQGMSDDRRAALAERRLSALPTISICDPAIAAEAARNYRRLRSLGITIRTTIDTLIATRCIVDGHALLHRDRDFQPFVDHLGLIDAMAA